jgi:signal transduction histidine kinase
MNRWRGIWVAFALWSLALVLAIVRFNLQMNQARKHRLVAWERAMRQERLDRAMWRLESQTAALLPDARNRDDRYDLLTIRPGEAGGWLSAQDDAATSGSALAVRTVAEFGRLIALSGLRERLIETLAAAARQSGPASPHTRDTELRSRTWNDNGGGRAIWIGGSLILTTAPPEGSVLPGRAVWLDWRRLREDLRGSVSDLFPEADVLPRVIGTTPRRDIDLAVLPIRLDPGAALGSLPPQPPTFLVGTIVIWLIVLMTIGAVGALLYLARDLSERRADFVAAVTHELRTPLTTIMMYSEMLERGIVGDARRRQEYLETLRAEAEHLQHLVDNVLVHARMGEEGAEEGLPARPLGELIAEIRPRLERRCAQAEMVFVLESPERNGSLPVGIDPTDFERIVVNLVDNAVKYAVRAQDRRVHLCWRRDGRQSVVAVRDHGPGIHPADAGRLFEPFYRSRRKSAKRAGGLGLGLPISRRLARRAGGDLQIDPSVVDGAGFLLRLPLV